MSVDAEFYRPQFKEIFRQAGEIGDKAERGQATARDMALLADLYQKYIDLSDQILEEGIDAAI